MKLLSGGPQGGVVIEWVATSALEDGRGIMDVSGSLYADEGEQAVYYGPA